MQYSGTGYRVENKCYAGFESPGSDTCSVKAKFVWTRDASNPTEPPPKIVVISEAGEASYGTSQVPSDFEGSCKVGSDTCPAPDVTEAYILSGVTVPEKYTVKTDPGEEITIETEVEVNISGANGGGTGNATLYASVTVPSSSASAKAQQAWSPNGHSQRTEMINHQGLVSSAFEYLSVLALSSDYPESDGYYRFYHDWLFYGPPPTLFFSITGNVQAEADGQDGLTNAYAQVETPVPQGRNWADIISFTSAFGKEANSIPTSFQYIYTFGAGNVHTLCLWSTYSCNAEAK